MKGSSLTVVLLISVVIVFVFWWQYMVNQRLTDDPQICYGDRYTNNSCGFGAGCVTQKTVKQPGWHPFYLPKTREDVENTLIQRREGQFSLSENSGYCAAWMDILTGATQVTPEPEAADN